MPPSGDIKLSGYLVFGRRHGVREAIVLRLSQAPLWKAEVDTSVYQLLNAVFQGLGYNNFAEDGPLV